MCRVWRGYDLAGVGGGEFALRLASHQRVAPLYWRSDTHTHTHTHTWLIHVKASVKEGNKNGMPGELVCILAQVMAQSAALEIARLSKEGRGGGTCLLVTLTLSEGEGCQKLHLSDLVDDVVGVQRLFALMKDPRYSRRNW
jgi:hypothetical protein